MKNFWLYAYAHELYLGLSSKRSDIAKEYFYAISGGDTALQNFVERYSDPLWDSEHTADETKYLLEAAERIAREGLDFGKKERK